MSTEGAKPAVSAETAPSTNGESDGKKKQDRKKDEKPIEELYDLSKPIPKVDRPDKDGHEKKLKELSEEIEVAKEKRRKVQEKIDKAMADPAAKSSLQGARGKLNELKASKNALIEEKKAMRAQLDKAKNETDKLMKEKKDVRSNVKFSSVDEIEKEIKKLQRKQETTSMSLNEEKRLIKDIDALKASKQHVASLKSADVSIDNVKEQRKTIAQRIAAKDKEIDALSKEIEEVMTTIKQQNDKDSKKRDTIGELFKERDALKAEMSEKIKQKDALRAEFREKNNAWYNYQRAVRAQKKIQYDEERKKREEEKAAYLAKLEEEEAKKIPYEAEQELCDFLADYLERTYLKKESDNKSNEKKGDVVEVKEDPFAGLKPMGKKNDVEEEYFGKSKGKKKRVRQPKKEAGAGPFTLSVDIFEQFGLIQLTPPTKIDQVEAKVKELREKKAWYKEQPRGSVPTAADIRKANEKEAAKLRSKPDPIEAKKQTKKNQGQFKLSEDDFAPLGAGGAPTTTINPGWGSGPLLKPPTTSNNSPTPAEAAQS